MKLLKFLFIGGLIAAVLFSIVQAVFGVPVNVDVIALVCAIVWIFTVYRMVMKLEPPSLNTYKREKVRS